VRKLLWLGIMAAGCTVSRSTPITQGAGEVETAVRQELERYYDDFTARDWPRFREHFWPGASITTVWQPPGSSGARVDAQTIDSFVAKAPLGPDSKPIFEERMTDAQIRIHRNLAQAWARYTARFGDTANVSHWQGIDAFTLMSHDGRWRIVSIAFTDLEDQPTGVR